MGITESTASMKAWLPGHLSHKYESLPAHSPTAPTSPENHRGFWRRNKGCITVAGITALVLVGVHAGTIYRHVSRGRHEMEDVSRLWGQYSPFYPVPSEIDPAIPAQCDVTFAQVLSRHGSRDPTAGKSEAYLELVGRIQDVVEDYGKGYEFIRDYEYTLGHDQLTAYGEREMVESGAAFYRRYRALAAISEPFVRASGQRRVEVSGRNWTQGFYAARAQDGLEAPDDVEDEMLIIPERRGANNTLSHGLCPAFESGPLARLGETAKLAWQDVFMPPVAARVNAALPGANLTEHETVYFMDLCPYETVADARLRPSAFCGLFTRDEWASYDYYQTVAKYYGFNAGHPLAATQGVGWVNELVARLTDTAVEDDTTTNRTLDSDGATFPLGRGMYADFSHDNDMLTIYAALGLYDGAAPLPRTRRQTAEASGGFSAGWLVPFGGRMYVEKMRCEGHDEEMVRVVVNERVVPLEACGSDALGRCGLGAFVEGLEFARTGGKWDQCFA
ncbi:hypothetical protein D7B24_006230 [Verticillium nonalfalfae]|uniref:Phytase A n=1 Tax=Verticillium nonalfalfae TaxID=1051616 RepID=A0A3M9Y9Y3_9PEZI|nr:uncharacterized protein D7B24_006230 [Verticillium nonalfalfae]RNJ57323.1 hypothetical protein D7B24_006230 [Verticillium nonalfalfae]